MFDFKNPYFKKWFLYAPIGFSLFAFGLCFAIEIAHLKHTGASFWQWFSLGTLALIITNAGLAFVADAIKNRMFYELEKKKESSDK